MWRRTGAVLMAVGFVSGLAGCGSDDGGGGGQQTLSIGVLAPLDAGLTQFGLGIRNSVQLAVDEANASDLIPGWRIQIVAVDDSSDPAVGMANAEQLLDDPTVIGVVGTYNSGVASAVLPDFQAAGIPLVSPGNTNPALTLGPDRNNPVRPYNNYFRMVANDAQQGGFLAQYAATRFDTPTAAVITDAKPVSQGLANDFRSGFEAFGGIIASFEIVPEGDTNYMPFAISAAATNPDLLFFGGEYDHAALLKQAAVAAGLDVPLMGGDGIQADEYITAVGAAAEGDLASSVGTPVELEPGGLAFLGAYEAHGFDEPPSTFGPYAYDAASILLSAAKRALAGRDEIDGAVLADVIANVQSITNATLLNPSGAVTGEIGFNAFGDTVHPVLTVYRVENGHWVPQRSE